MHSEPGQHRNAFIVVLVVLALVAFLGMIRPYMLTLATAAVFSILLHPFYQWTLPRVGDNQALASALVLAGAALTIGLPLLGLFSLVAVEGVRVGQSALPWLEERLRNPSELTANLPAWLTIPESLQPYTNRIVEQLGQWVATAGRFIVQYVSKATQGTLGFVVKQFVMLYAMFFFLIWGPAMFDGLLRNLPLSADDRKHIIAKGLSVTRATIKGILVIGLVQGLLVGIAFEIAGLEGAAFWGALVVPISAMPLVGPPIIWGPAGLYLIAQGNFVAGVGLLLWGALIVGTIDNILRPRLVGGDTKMSDLLILISTLGGLGSFGPVGIILGPVLAGVLITVLDIYRRTPELHEDDDDEVTDRSLIAQRPNGD
ncbi:MAG: AI-2E family transporter [Pseudomonadota bacterium]